MDKPARHFLHRLLIITGIFILSGVIIFGLFLKQYYFSLLPLLLVFVFLFTFLTYRHLLKAAEKGMGNFTRASMIVITVRFLTFAGIAVLYLAFVKVNAVSFVVSFVLLYLVFTFFEVSELISFLRHKGMKEKKT